MRNAIHGSSNNYSLRSVTTNSASGTGIYDSDNDLIAVVEGATNLSLGGSYFDFV